jgi:DeoR/GlpR family transcriptional regulator of sugar metabolism
MVNRKDIEFEDIVKLLKEDVKLNIYKLCHRLNCSDSLIYRRIIENDYDGLTDLKEAVNNGNL